jgi:hypothetical protein
MKSKKSQGGLTHGSGMSESVRTMLIKFMPTLTSIHQVMAHLTKLDFKTSQQHTADMGMSRIHEARQQWPLKKTVSSWMDPGNPGTLSSISLSFS